MWIEKLLQRIGWGPAMGIAIGAGLFYLFTRETRAAHKSALDMANSALDIKLKKLELKTAEPQALGDWVEPGNEF